MGGGGDAGEEVSVFLGVRNGLIGLTGLYRFRPNIVMKGAGAWAEDAWEEIRIGSETAPKMTLVSACARCLVCFFFLFLPCFFVPFILLHC